MPTRLLATFLFAFTLHLSAQITGVALGPVQTQPLGPTGTVTGIVIDQDTQRPVRLAQVLLQAIRDPSEESRGRPNSGFRGGNTIARTGLDGTFTMEYVAVGDYYAIALDAGYIPMSALLQAQFNAGANPADLIRQVPTVHVAADGNATVTVNVQHGGTIGGRVQWEDGTPAAGVQMSLDPVAQPQPMPAPLNTLSRFGNRSIYTDDRGEFRLPGLATGDYILSATITSSATRSTSSSMIRSYAPGVFRKTEARPISVRIGDERNDTRLVLDLSSLRKISGHVSSSASGLSVRSGGVHLQDSVDTKLSVFGTINASGDFTVPNIPPGTYTMTVAGTSQEHTNGRRSSTDPAIAFQPASQPIIIGTTDVSGIAITLNPTTH